MPIAQEGSMPMAFHRRTKSTDSSISFEQQQINSTLRLYREASDVRLAVVKISNIAWDLTSSDVQESLPDFPLGKEHIHIPIDRFTGKTKADMYIELPTIVEAIKCCAKYQRHIWKGRAIGLGLSSMEELIANHFPFYFMDPHGELLTMAECISYINICRNYKVFATYNRIVMRF